MLCVDGCCCCCCGCCGNVNALVAVLLESAGAAACRVLPLASTVCDVAAAAGALTADTWPDSLGAVRADADPAAALLAPDNAPEAAGNAAAAEIGPTGLEAARSASAARAVVSCPTATAAGATSCPSAGGAVTAAGSAGGLTVGVLGALRYLTSPGGKIFLSRPNAGACSSAQEATSS